MSLKVTILGCGSSGGVPRVASGWGKCDPSEPKNRRRRCSILVERSGPGGVTRLVVDTGPDLRDQLIGAGVDRVDGVLYTHEHADHSHGIDDLRPLAIHARARVDIWCDAKMSDFLNERFGYVFASPPGSDYPPILNEHRLIAGEPASIAGPGGSIEALPLEVAHGQERALGFRFGSLAYVPDVNDIPDASAAMLEGLDVLIIDALRDTPHPTHFSLDDALDWIERLKPRRAVLTNLHTDMDYATLKSRLPPEIDVAYDGMVIETAL
ncbi:MBL fold metallo-hydrolase [Chelatococcus sambhunathii]|uniref:MBL fold metallo-hydrolase n=1 Tax=Chelatococcus sambhunathii TaxID=363953 RepID=A0ABU1DFR8_9HYPH|nr:MBL fold metallo-hydrolase [Chelatococcus sambhunathii]MDR4306960.1 MBL fold metallo-hydrolase [Chelatococcus sambhunathii]